MHIYTNFFLNNTINAFSFHKYSYMFKLIKHNQNQKILNP